jgi:hypothetical protein
MRSRTPIRGASPVRSGRTVKRASARLTRTRIASGSLMAASIVAGVVLCLTPAFGMTQVVVDGNDYTSSAAVTEKLALTDGQSLFLLDTRSAAARVREIPSVAGATVDLRLPGTIVVHVVEREPILAWVVGSRRLLVDSDGTVVAEHAVDASNGAGSGTGSSGTSLPAVTDARVASSNLGVGTVIDARDLDAATRLASLRPVDVGSTADSLTLAVDDTDGWTIKGAGKGWTALFGSYATSARPPSMIPGQVRLLRSLMIGREASLVRILLADETHGTYTTK